MRGGDDPALPPAPAAARPRYALIDALRGFALAGVLMVNLASLSLYEFLPDPARAALPSAGFDAWALQAMALLVDIKFITLFSLLFGMGFALQLDAAPPRAGAGRRYARRMAVLALIGALHGFVVWWGDILPTYAVAGLLLLGLRRLPEPALWIAGLLIALVLPPLLAPAMRGVLADWGVPAQSAVYAEALRAFAGDSWAQALQQNLAVASWARLSNWALLCFVLGRFLLGYWAGRRGLLQAPAQHKPLLRRLFVAALLLGAAATWLQFAQAGLRAQYPALDTEAARMLIRIALRAGPLALGVAYACGFALLYLTPWGERALRGLAPVGRMALTHYLAQSLIGIGLFYGIGLGWGPRHGVALWWLVWATVFAAQVALSHWWLARYRQGPVEWLWRRLAAGAGA